MKILSFDIGIKNLAYCYINTDDCNSIIKWDIINLNNIKIEPCYFENCNKPAKFHINNIHSCKRHMSKHDVYFENKNNYTSSTLKKMNVNELNKICHGLNIEAHKYKKHMVQSITHHVKSFAFNPCKKENSKHTDLIKIGQNINILFNIHFTDIDIDTILIENQIGSIASRMLTVQGMIAQYFIINNPLSNIKFYSPHNKLKLFKTGVKLNYKQRKQLSISKTLEIINNDYISWVDYFLTNKKKDDLADSFLQCIAYMRLT
jgi:hypothetical protein